MNCLTHQNQFAYQVGIHKDGASQCHNTTENAIKHKEIALGAFLDTEGIFARTLFGAIGRAANQHGVEPTI
jgi:hypothetical protein